MTKEPKFKCIECGESIGLLDSYTIPGEGYFDAGMGMQVQPTKKYCEECFNERIKPIGLNLTENEIKTEIAKGELEEETIIKLFEILRKKRLEIAKSKKFPAYCVFDNITLKEMASIKPNTKQEMLRIRGVGEEKFREYGEIFLNEIRIQNI